MKKKLLIALCAVIGVSILVVTQVSAVINESIQLRNNSVGIAISPVNSERLNFLPGDSFEGKFRVRQIGRDTNDVFAEVAPYSAGSEDDYDNSDFFNPNARTEIVKWMSLDLEGCDITSRQSGKMYFTMRPKEECYIKYRINVPRSALGGSQRAAIFVQNIIKDGQSGGMGIESTYRMGHLVSADIDGPGAKYEGRIIENNIPWLFFDPPIFVTSRVENSGNSDFKVRYEVEIKNIFSGASNYSTDKEKMVLSDSIRGDKISWEGSPFLGIFNVTQKITFLNETSELTKMVFIIPIWLIIVIIIVIVLLIAARIMKSREKKRNRRNQ